MKREQLHLEIHSSFTATGYSVGYCLFGYNLPFDGFAHVCVCVCVNTPLTSTYSQAGTAVVIEVAIPSTHDTDLSVQFSQVKILRKQL